MACIPFVEALEREKKGHRQAQVSQDFVSVRRVVSRIVSSTAPFPFSRTDIFPFPKSAA
jgi:hypothetical protein